MEHQLLNEIDREAIIKNYTPGEFIITQDSIVRFLPIVIEGRVKIYSQEDSVQFLMYYINTGETCINSFANIIDKAPAAFSAITEVETKLILLPMESIIRWLDIYPSLSKLVLSDYQRHYRALLQATKEITTKSLEDRLLNLLQTKSRNQATDLLTVSHRELALDLGTSREVVTRLLLKLKTKGHVDQIGRKIKVS